MDRQELANYLNENVDQMQRLARSIICHNSYLSGGCYYARAMQANEISDVRAAVGRGDWLIAWAISQGLPREGDINQEYGRRYIVEAALSQDCLDECLAAHSFLSKLNPFTIVDFIESLWVDLLDFDQHAAGIRRVEYLPRGGWQAFKHVLIDRLSQGLPSDNDDAAALLQKAEEILARFDVWIAESEADMQQRLMSGLTIRFVIENT